MAYVVEQKIKGRIYLYKVESYWDKNKKQPRQRRTYIGPKRNGNKPKTKLKESALISKNYGNIFLLEFLSNKLGLTEILKAIFPDSYREILSLAFYEITEASALYLFPYWLDEQYLPNVKKLHSTSISNLCEDLGRLQTHKIDFLQRWIEHQKPIKGVYYDITSVSSYSTNIDFIEWGYNRDNENLAQLNIGVTFCQNSALPIYYNLYPGSIVDVTTLKNCIKYLKVFGLKDILFVLDRGFFSKANILEMNNNEIVFIQPLPFTLKKVKEVIKKHRKQLAMPINAFKYKEELLHYLSTSIDFDKNAFDAHIFFNEKSEIDQKHKFLSSLLELEDKLKNKKLKTLKEYLHFKNSSIVGKYREYFKWNKTTLKIEKNMKRVKAYISKLGSFVLLTNQQGMDKLEVLSHYREKDSIEKLFDIVKNEIDGNRLRSHSQYNTEGRLFLKFIALIVYMELSKTMKEKKLFDKYSVKELLAELKKLKITTLKHNNPFLSELSKKQKIIFKAFGIKGEMLHSY